MKIFTNLIYNLFIGFGYYILIAPGVYLILFFIYILRNLIYRVNIKPEDLYGKNLISVFFLPFSKFPKDKDLFLKIKSLGCVSLPKLDLNNYILNGVDISGVKFNKYTVLPKDLDFMQKIKNRDLSYCTMPKGDYRKYNFNGVHLYDTKFPEGCILPDNYDFFIKLNPKSLIFINNMPKYITKKIHLYKLTKRIRIYKSLLSKEQDIYLKLKYADDYSNIVNIKNKNFIFQQILYNNKVFNIILIIFTCFIFYYIVEIFKNSIMLR